MGDEDSSSSLIIPSDLHAILEAQKNVILSAANTQIRGLQSNVNRKLIKRNSAAAREGGYLTKFNTGRLRPEVHPLTLLYGTLAEKVPLLYTYFRKSCSHFHEGFGLSLLLGKPAQREGARTGLRSYARCSTLPYPDQKDQRDRPQHRELRALLFSMSVWVL